ncbi:MAG TPA: cell division protein FtsL [Archangium sp.]|jgi:cell division protein FtsL
MSVVLEARNKGGLSLSVIILEIFPAALAVFLLATVGIVHVTSRVMVVRMGYDLSKLDQKSIELQRENDALKVELATLTSPAKLAPVAREKLGMQVPTLVIPLKKD